MSGYRALTAHQTDREALPEDESPMIDQQPTTIDPQPPQTTVVSLTDAAVS